MFENNLKNLITHFKSNSVKLVRNVPWLFLKKIIKSLHHDLSISAEPKQYSWSVWLAPGEWSLIKTFERLSLAGLSVALIRHLLPNGFGFSQMNIIGTILFIGTASILTVFCCLSLSAFALYTYNFYLQLSGLSGLKQEDFQNLEKIVTDYAKTLDKAFTSDRSSSNLSTLYQYYNDLKILTREETEALKVKILAINPQFNHQFLDNFFEAIEDEILDALKDLKDKCKRKIDKINSIDSIDSLESLYFIDNIQDFKSLSHLLKECAKDLSCPVKSLWEQVTFKEFFLVLLEEKGIDCLLKQCSHNTPLENSTTLKPLMHPRDHDVIMEDCFYNTISPAARDYALIFINKLLLQESLLTEAELSETDIKPHLLAICGLLKGFDQAIPEKVSHYFSHDFYEQLKISVSLFLKKDALVLSVDPRSPVQSALMDLHGLSSSRQSY